MSRTHVPAEWYPLGARRLYGGRPEAGVVLGMRRAVLKVLAATVPPRSEWTPEDIEQVGKYPVKAQDNAAPFRLEVEFIGGIIPKRLAEANETVGVLMFRAATFQTWWEYPHGRWPQCSCCGEAMPCRAELADLRVDAAMEQVEVLGSRLPGCCWGCGDPVTSRQKVARYPGDNLEMPGGPSVAFHARASCYHLAARYERKWLAADRTRRRIVTWPSCRGWLIWHEDGSMECVGGDDPECRGYLTHNHGSQAGCRYMTGGCPRGCDPGRSSCNPNRIRRPDFRPADYPQGRPDGERTPTLPLGAGDPGDDRDLCSGTLIRHQDGTEECKAGGRDDCWDGSKYRHDRAKSCQDQTAGCPTCETSEGLA